MDINYFNSTRVLDGGMGSYISAGQKLTSEPTELQSTQFVAKIDDCCNDVLTYLEEMNYLSLDH